ncbi:hypothetical protein DFH08DRAFT_798027 [Mycena albidolilacea]|uniref:Uncharacterized protein n=1 Tax=Mycena albidolilacea TaxID=1033008 RepID=A0AAD7ASK4_9AGAR|nr:hypothetical protein DFH08DRAFT_798027 [Mycena albidolilacea]
MPEQIEAPFSDIFATHMQDAHARIPFPVSIATSGVRRPPPRRSSITEIQSEKLTSLLRQETIEAAELWSALRSRSGTVSRILVLTCNVAVGGASCGAIRVGKVEEACDTWKVGTHDELGCSKNENTEKCRSGKRKVMAETGTEPQRRTPNSEPVREQKTTTAISVSHDTARTLTRNLRGTSLIRASLAKH